MLATLAFYLFSFVTIGSALMVIIARNPVHAVLFLILAFFSSAGLMLMLGAEFIAMILVIVYVGAVAVLFLFVVMMLDINFAKLRAGFMNYVPIGLMVGVVLLIQLGLVISGIVAPMGLGQIPSADPAVTNSEALGQVLYTDYILAFQVSGLILLVAMIGAIVLTLRDRGGVRRQNIRAQIDRRTEDVIEIRKVTTGSGV